MCTGGTLEAQGFHLQMPRGVHACLDVMEAPPVLLTLAYFSLFCVQREALSLANLWGEINDVCRTIEGAVPGSRICRRKFVCDVHQGMDIKQTCFVTAQVAKEHSVLRS